MVSRRPFFAAVAFVVAISPVCATAGEALVFAAASLKNALDAVVARYHDTTGGSVTVSYASTPALAKQIEQGAPADIFFSADVDWMDYLAERGLIDTQTRRTLLASTLVLIVPRDSPATVTIGPNMDLIGLLGPIPGDGGRLAVADVEAVPAGRYAKAALETLGVWAAVAGRVVEAENVRAALAFVARGEAPAGIVYATDAAAEPAVRVVATFPAHTHPPILYSLAMTSATRNPEARAVFDFLQSTVARPIYELHGFVFIAPGS